LADHDAGHERIAGHVPAYPELVFCDILIADNEMAFVVERDDGGKLLHLEALRVATADPFSIDQDPGGVDRRGINEGNRRHSETSFPKTGPISALWRRGGRP